MRWSLGGPAMVELLDCTPAEGTPMTDDRLPLAELMAKADDGDFLRSVAESVLQILMETDVEGVIGAARYERSGERADPGGVAGAGCPWSSDHACGVGGLAGRADPALHPAGGVAATAASAGVGQSYRSQDAGLGAVAVRPWHHAALHARGRQLAQYGGVDPARART